jgi:hypothetical protein
MNERIGMSDMGFKFEDVDKKKNKWKIATIILLGLTIILLVYGSYKQYKSTDLCSIVESTPSWINSSNDIIKTGYLQIISYSIENETLRNEYYLNLKKTLEDVLIFNNITFAYKDTCSWCEKQINEFKEVGFWEEYERSGLTINCNDN